MLEPERKGLILRLLSLYTFVNIHEIVDATKTSEATIRRDFAEMERAGLLRRVRGGVEVIRMAIKEPGEELPLDRRVVFNHEKKRKIAKAASSFIKPGETIIIDGGSTTFLMAEFLTLMDITIVTNSFAIIEHLFKHSQCRLILPEGMLDPRTQLILNSVNPDPFANYRASIAFMGVEGISEDFLTNTSPNNIQMERSMIAHASEIIILADDSKFGKIGHLALCPVERATRIITSADASPELVEELRMKGVEVIQV
jgi:DeoR family ulaG and ulaABCDEF operon transcriptional repressor